MPGGVLPSHKQMIKHQQAVLQKINDAGPPDTWKDPKFIHELFADIILFGIKGSSTIEKLKKLPKDLKDIYTRGKAADTDDVENLKNSVYVITQCPYVEEFLKEKKWDVRSRLLEAIGDEEDRKKMIEETTCTIEEVGEESVTGTVEESETKEKRA